MDECIRKGDVPGAWVIIFVRGTWEEPQESLDWEGRIGMP